MGKNDYAGLLYSEPSFLEGLARVLDIGGMFDSYNESATSAEADRLAMMADWYAVSDDLLHAAQSFADRVDRNVADDSNVRSR